MYCSKCGKEIPEDSQFCRYCGNTTNNNISNNSSETNSNKSINLKNICIGVIILFFIIIGIQTYYINNNKNNVIKNEPYTSTNNNVENSVSNVDTSNNSIASNNSQLTGIEQAIQDGMINDYITEGVSESKLSFAFSEGNLQMYYDSWEACFEDAKKLNIIKNHDDMYEFPNYISTFPIEAGDGVQTRGVKHFRKEPDYNSEIIYTSNSLTTVTELKGDWANTYLGWIPIYDLDGVKPVQVQIVLHDSRQHYIEVEKNYYITGIITFHLSQKNGTLTEALSNVNDILNFELKQEDGKTYISSISGIKSSKKLENNEKYKWVVKNATFGDVFENLDEVNIRRLQYLKIEYVPIN